MRLICFLFFACFFIGGNLYAQNLIYDEIQQQNHRQFFQSSQPLFQEVEAINQKYEMVKHNQYVSTLKVNEQFHQSLFQKQPSFVRFTLPLYGKNTEILLQKNENMMDYPVYVQTKQGKQLHSETLNGVFYQGILQGNKNSLVTLSVYQDELTALISNEEGQHNLVKNNQEATYSLFPEWNLKQESPFQSCEEMEVPEKTIFDVESQLVTSKRERAEHKPKIQAKRQNGKIVGIYLEADYRLFKDKGSDVNETKKYVNGLYNQVTTLYQNEQIPISISELLVWQTEDPYKKTNSSLDALKSFAERMRDNSFNGNLAQLLSSIPNRRGGLAWIDILCKGSDYYQTSFAEVTLSYKNVPVYSWSVNVVAHELGHNFGSKHTHSCVWNGNNTQIDDCGSVYSPAGAESCYDKENQKLPNKDMGTIMSYCHLLRTVGVNLANGFGKQPGDLIRDRYNKATCMNDSDNDGVQDGKDRCPNTKSGATVDASGCSEEQNQALNDYTISTIRTNAEYVYPKSTVDFFIATQQARKQVKNVNTGFYISQHKTLQDGAVKYFVGYFNQSFDGNSNTLSVNGRLPELRELALGKYYVIGKVDYDNQVKELDETNNENSDYFHVIADSQSEVYFTNGEITLPNQLKKGETLRFRTSIGYVRKPTNEASVGYKIFISKDCKVTADDMLFTTGQINVASGAQIAGLSVNEVFNLSIPSGDYKLLLVLDADNQIAEYDENNNIICTPIKIESDAPVQDSDGDGIPDFEDKCKDEFGFAVADGCFKQLTNKAVEFINPTCTGELGSIYLTNEFAKPIQYIVRSSAKEEKGEIAPNAKISISKLVAAKYEVLFSHQTDFKQSFQGEIVAPPAVTFFVSDVVTKTRTVQLSNLTGTAPYSIFVNGKLETTTYQTEIQVQLNKGKNKIEVQSAKSCEGMMQKTIELNLDLVVLPNPFTSTITLRVPQDYKNSQLTIVSIGGQVHYQKQFVGQSVDLSHLGNGGYIAILKNENGEFLYSKLIKQ